MVPRPPQRWNLTLLAAALAFLAGVVILAMRFAVRPPLPVAPAPTNLPATRTPAGRVTETLPIVTLAPVATGIAPAAAPPPVTPSPTAPPLSPTDTPAPAETTVLAIATAVPTPPPAITFTPPVITPAALPAIAPTAPPAIVPTLPPAMPPTASPASPPAEQPVRSATPFQPTATPAPGVTPATPTATLVPTAPPATPTLVVSTTTPTRTTTPTPDTALRTLTLLVEGTQPRADVVYEINGRESVPGRNGEVILPWVFTVQAESGSEVLLLADGLDEYGDLRCRISGQGIPDPGIVDYDPNPYPQVECPLLVP